MSITLKDHEAVVLLNEERHFARAARRLGVSQPALTSRLARLEAELGARLFRRDRNGVEPTAEGVAFCEGARRVLEANVEAIKSLNSVADGFGTTLRIGMTQLATHQVVVPTLRKFRLEFPRAQIRLIEGTTWSLERDLEQGDLDAAFLHPPLHAPSLTQKVLASAHVVSADLGDGVCDDIVRYPRSEAPVMMGVLERASTSQQQPGKERTSLVRGDSPLGLAEGNTAIACLALSASGYGTAFVTDHLPDFGFDLETAR